MAKKPDNYDRMSPEDRALWDYINAGNEFVDGGAAQYQTGNPLAIDSLNPSDLAQLGASQYGNITTDPRLANAELAALSSLEERAMGSGLSLQDEADMARLKTQTNAQNRGRQGAIQQEMQRRGMTGSGMDLVARMQAAQAATDQEALASLEKVAMAQAGQRDAAARMGGMASSMRGQQFNEQAQKAAAQDAIARFNTANTVGQQQANWQAQQRANQANWDRTNQTSDRNTASQYDYRKDKVGTQQGNAQMSYNKATDDYNRRMLAKQQKDAKRKGVGTAIGTVVGGVGGAFVGGPAGAMAGAQVGGALGGAFAHGGVVPGDSPFPGDNEMNDIFPAQLTPGEVVLPKTIANQPELASQYTAAVKAGMDPMAAKYVAQNQAQKSADRPFYPTPDGLPIPEAAQRKYDRRTDGSGPKPSAMNLSSPEATPALSPEAAKSKSILDAYRERMKGVDADLKSAQDIQGYMSIANVAGKGLTDFANSQKQDVILKNRMQDLGKMPSVSEADRKEYDGSMLDKLAAQNVGNAKGNRAQAEDQFMTEQRMSAADRDLARSDPNSEESKAARAFLSTLIPNAESKIAGMSAAQLDKASPLLMQKFNADRAQANANRSYSLQERELDMKGKKPLNEGQQKTVNYASATLTGLNDMRSALKSGDNTFSVVGDNNFTEARRRAAENFGRLQSGGAISKDEEARFIDMLPTWTDSAEMQERKLAKLEAEMRARIGSEGVDADEQLKMRGGTTQPSVDPQDQQAAQWAQANPNDPRAAKIMEKLRSKYGQ
jgi:hypothetical protein